MTKIFDYSEFYSFLKNNDFVFDSCIDYINSCRELELECCQKRNKRARAIQEFKKLKLSETEINLIKNTLQVSELVLVYDDIEILRV